MRVRKLGRWIGRLLAVASFGAVAALGASAAVADEVECSEPDVADVASVPPGASPQDYIWD